MIKRLDIVIVLFAIGTFIGTYPTSARDWVVDNKNPSASDTDSGTMESPFKTIGATASSIPATRQVPRPSKRASLSSPTSSYGVSNLSTTSTGSVAMVPCASAVNAGLSRKTISDGEHVSGFWP